MDNKRDIKREIYSLPETDTTMRTFLKVRAPTPKIPLHVVDVPEGTAQRYAILLGTHYEIDDSYVDNNAIEEFAAGYTGD